MLANEIRLEDPMLRKFRKLHELHQLVGNGENLQSKMQLFHY